jgi:PleD family two-component response regulator
LDLAWQLVQNARTVQLIPSDLTASWPLTISIGVATRTHESQGSMGGFLALADARLTEAQEAGGAQVKGVLMP